MKTFDVLIIGGGPAGTTTGLTILKKPGISVAIIEQSAYTQARIGEVLSPGMRNMLAYFDVWEAFKTQHTLDAFSSQAVWGREERSSMDYLFTTHGSGWHLDRLAFDKMLADKFSEKGGELLLNTKYLDAQEIDGNWLVEVKKEDRIERIKASYIVDASGRKGIFAKQRKVNRIHDDQLVGIGCFADIDASIKQEQSILIEACEYGWWYTAPTPNDKMSVILMTDLDMINELGAAKAAAWKELLWSTKHTSSRVKKLSFEANPRSFLAHSSKLDFAGADNWLAVGDAFSSHDPLSSSGIPHALGSGAYAARVVVAALQGNKRVLHDYNQEISAQYVNYLDTKRNYYGYEQRWPNAKFWKRRNEVIRIMADQVVNEQLELPDQAIHLLMEQYKTLQVIAQKGDQAHTVVRKFKERHPQVADQSVILALQDMLPQLSFV